MNDRNSPKIQHANPKLERILLGGLITNADVYWAIEHSIRIDSFTTPLHREMFRELEDMIVAGQTVKMPLLWSRLPDEGEIENGQKVSVRSYISICIEEASEVSPTDVADDIAELASKRRILRWAAEATKAISKGEKRSDEIAAEMEAEALDIVGVAMPNRPKRLSDLAKNVIRKSRMAQETGEQPGVSTGLATLDELIGLIFPTDLIGLMASQSDGKSALSQQIGMHVSKSKPVLMIQMEMSAEEVAVREVAAESGISSYAIRDGSVNSFDFEEKISPTEQALMMKDFHVYDARKMTVRQIKGVALSLHRRKPLGMLIIDQLDKIKSEGFTKDKFERAEQVLTDLKDLAKEIKVPILILAQRSRMGQRENEVPNVNDSSMGPALEQNCDTLIGLWRREAWLHNQGPKGKGEMAITEWKMDLEAAKGHAGVVVLKRRTGARNVQRELKWVGRITRFFDI